MGKVSGYKKFCQGRKEKEERLDWKIIRPAAAKLRKSGPGGVGRVGELKATDGPAEESCIGWLQNTLLSHCLGVAH